MKSYRKELYFNLPARRGFINITPQVEEAVRASGVTEGLIPYESRGRESDTGEERRLFYVGMTRAQAEIVLLTSQQPSPFLDTLPGLVFSEAFPKREEEPNQMSLFD